MPPGGCDTSPSYTVPYAGRLWMGCLLRVGDAVVIVAFFGVFFASELPKGG